MAIDRQQLIQRVQEIEGLSDDERAGLLQLLREQKKYGIVWEDKPEEAEERLASELPVLIEDTDRYIPGATPDAPNHILIEGDNLHALTALNYTHEGKIDVIYIDPPYNTGNKDFVYNDSYVDREDGYRHSKWLSFMNKRLKIAKRLLSDRGVIFISIDDNEQAQLKMLCDEVFGEEKFISSFVWQKKTGAADANGIAIITENILSYCNQPNDAKNIFAYNKEAFDIKRYRYSDEFVKERGPYYLDSLDRGSIQYSDGLNYGIEAPDGTMIYPNGRTTFANDGWTWKWSKDKVIWGLEHKFIEISKTDKKACGWAVKYKIYLYVDNEGNKIQKSVPFKNLIQGILNADAASDIKNMFGNKAFDYAKPTSLIKLIISFIESKNSTILDFFAGSGTTLHATMQLNAEDGGRRQCILVTNNENGICENVTYERNKRVIQGYTTPKGVAVAGLTDNTLRYYRTDFVPNETTIRNKRRLMELSTDMLCIKNNLYCEQDEFAGRKLNKQKMRYFTTQPIINSQLSFSRTTKLIINYTSMLVVYDEQVVDSLVDVLTEMNVEQKIMIYVFSNTSYPHTDNFEEVLSKVELCALPSAIMNAYRKVCRP